MISDYRILSYAEHEVRQLGRFCLDSCPAFVEAVGQVNSRLVSWTYIQETQRHSGWHITSYVLRALRYTPSSRATILLFLFYSIYDIYEYRIFCFSAAPSFFFRNPDPGSYHIVYTRSLHFGRLFYISYILEIAFSSLVR